MAEEAVLIRDQAAGDEYFEDGKRKIDFILVWKKEEIVKAKSKNSKSRSKKTDEALSKLYRNL